jgi:hypothetical protein
LAVWCLLGLLTQTRDLWCPPHGDVIPAIRWHGGWQRRTGERRRHPDCAISMILP